MKNLLPFLFGDNAINNQKTLASLENELLIFSVIVGILLALIVAVLAGMIPYKTGPCPRTDDKKISSPNDSVIRRAIAIIALIIVAAIPYVINSIFAISKILAGPITKKAEIAGYASSGVAVVSFIICYGACCWLGIYFLKSYKPKTVLVSSGKILGLISLKGKKKK